MPFPIVCETSASSCNLVDMLQFYMTTSGCLGQEECTLPPPVVTTDPCSGPKYTYLEYTCNPKCSTGTYVSNSSCGEPAIGQPCRMCCSPNPFSCQQLP